MASENTTSYISLKMVFDAQDYKKTGCWETNVVLEKEYGYYNMTDTALYCSARCLICKAGASLHQEVYLMTWSFCSRN